ncbi:AGAP008610-PA, partial [Anopheles gambiae str. PEST]
KFGENGAKQSTAPCGVRREVVVGNGCVAAQYSAEVTISRISSVVGTAGVCECGGAFSDL